MLKPNVGHGLSVGRPEQLHLMTFQNSDEITKTATKNRLVELGGSKPLGDIDAAEPGKDKGCERDKLKACKTRGW